MKDFFKSQPQIGDKLTIPSTPSQPSEPLSGDDEEPGTYTPPEAADREDANRENGFDQPE